MPIPRPLKCQQQNAISGPNTFVRDTTKRPISTWPAFGEVEDWPAFGEAEEPCSSNDNLRLEDDPEILIGLQLPLEDGSDSSILKTVEHRLHHYCQLPAAPLLPPATPLPTPGDAPESPGAALPAPTLPQPATPPPATPKASSMLVADDNLQSSQLPDAGYAEESVQSTDNEDNANEDPQDMHDNQAGHLASSSSKSDSSAGEDRADPQEVLAAKSACTFLQSIQQKSDLKVAESIAGERGLPPDMNPEYVRPFLLQYGYDALDHKHWASDSADQLPQLKIDLVNHIEFGSHTQYEFICRAQPREGMGVAEMTWRTIRRLKHIRRGLHDPIKKALGSKYGHYFSCTPFAHHTAPAGTTARLQAWFASLATCTNSGSLEPCLVAQIFRVLDGPGTPLYAQGDVPLSFPTAEDLEQIPVTASMFGSKHMFSSCQRQGPSHCQMNAKQTADAFFKEGADVAMFELSFDAQQLEQKVTIFHRPLGAEFSKPWSGPVRIGKVKPGSYAEQLGMKAGWIVKSVGGVDAHTLTFEQMQEAIKGGLMRLPLAMDPGQMV